MHGEDSHRNSLVHDANQVKAIHVGVLGRHELLENTQQTLYLVILGDDLCAAKNQRFP